MFLKLTKLFFKQLRTVVQLLSHSGFYEHFPREVYHQLSALFGNNTLADIKYVDRNRGLPNQIIEIMIFLWLQVNIFNGVGTLAYKFPYQGMCFPAACSTEEIHQNSLEFSRKYQLRGLPPVISSPVVPPELADLLQQPGDLAVGCSDDQMYSGEWRPENYVVIALLGTIALCILLTTALDIQGNSSQFVKAFSLKENLQFVFAAPDSGASGRFGCLEGMRSLSMTW